MIQVDFLNQYTFRCSWRNTSLTFFKRVYSTAFILQKIFTFSTWSSLSRSYVYRLAVCRLKTTLGYVSLLYEIANILLHSVIDKTNPMYPSEPLPRSLLIDLLFPTRFHNIEWLESCSELCTQSVPKKIKVLKICHCRNDKIEILKSINHSVKYVDDKFNTSTQLIVSSRLANFTMMQYMSNHIKFVSWCIQAIRLYLSTIR